MPVLNWIEVQEEQPEIHKELLVPSRGETVNRCRQEHGWEKLKLLWV